MTTKWIRYNGEFHANKVGVAIRFMTVRHIGLFTWYWSVQDLSCAERASDYTWFKHTAQKAAIAFVDNERIY